ncbi:hypothetical protein ACHWQZ_G005467 [Mnemiopsis leidyi]
MAVVQCAESQDHVLLQYYKLGNSKLDFNVTPPNAQVIGTLPRLYDRPSRTACYKISAWPLVTQEFQSRSPSVVKPSRGGPRQSKRPGARLVPLERASCGIAMEVAKADSKTNWEALMNHINDSIRDTQQQRMLGQYMIQKLKKEQTMANIPPEQAASNKRCLESLIQRYGTGLEDVVSKEREFERLIEAYQVFMRGDKKKMQRKVERKQQSARKIKGAEDPLPAIGDQKAGRSQVGCKIRHELRKEYGERVRMDFASRSAGSKRVLPTQPAPKPMSVRVRKSVTSGQDERETTLDRACDEIDLPPTPVTPKLGESAEELQETESQLSMTYVPSENQSLAQLIPEEGEDQGITVVIKPEEDIPEEKPSSPIQEEPEEESEETMVEKETEEEECIVLEGDSDPNVLIVNSQTELIPSQPSVTPKFEIVETIEEKAKSPEPVAEQSVEEPAATKEEAEQPEPVTEPVVEDTKTETVDPVKEVSADSAEPELEKLIDAEEPEELQAAALNLVNGVFQTLDLEAASESEETEKPELKEVKFKSSPDIVYYEKQSPEKELACHPDDKLILTEDLSTAESELNEEAKALYHKVLSTAHTEENQTAPAVAPKAEKVPTPEAAEVKVLTPEAAEEKVPTPEAAEKRVPTPEAAEVKVPTPEAAEDEQLVEMARELTDSVIKNASGSTSSKPEAEAKKPKDLDADSDIAETAKVLTEKALENATAAV